MVNKSVGITINTKDLLDEIKTKYKIGTYDLCIHSMAVFMLKNNVNPQDEFVGDFKKALIDLEMRLNASFENLQKRMIKDNASLRSWVGGISKDHLIPITKKIELLDKIIDLGIDKKITNNLELSQNENPLNNGIEREENSSAEIEELKKMLEEKKVSHSHLYKENEVLKNILFNIVNNSKVEKTGMLGKEKIVVDISLEEWKKVKESI